MDNDPSTRPKPRRGVYLLPNLFTTGAMFAGFYGIIAAFGGQYTDAVIAIFVAGLLDGLDGRVARLTNTQSEFGVQYDSLSDLVSFGVAPALVLYVWSLKSRLGRGVCFRCLRCPAPGAFQHPGRRCRQALFPGSGDSRRSRTRHVVRVVHAG
jgi:phosphatidylserine synthase